MWALVAAIFLVALLSMPVQTRAQKTDQNNEQDTEQTERPKKKLKSEKPKLNENEDKVETERAPERAAAADLPAVLVREPDDVSTLDLYGGIGGRDGAPDPNGTFTFLREDLSQTQPKFDVRDAQGREWRIKVGKEARPETAATRLVWAAGYYVDEDYYFPQVKVEGLPKHLTRGQKFVGKGGVVRGARLKLMPKGQKDIGYWSWRDNPFVDSRELNGLRVMMALMNNWDLIRRNNKIYRTDGERRFVVSDLGASFGRSGNELTHRKGNLEAYSHSRFIARSSADTVDFVDHSRPIPIAAVLPSVLTAGIPNYYKQLVNAQKVVKGIPWADAKWIDARLAQFSEDQIRDCFRAAGYSPEEVEGFTRVVRERIAALQQG